ncbi:hypothetical protein SAMN02746009_00322 [Hymenobacter psychrotolerans DSM 18569]|uniref:Uncharacterized protein n=2 Tax=Hymenobacter psychrotolerans TaxID=344998 RepID=A0A1M6PRS6_9BACT|nr:hypothetical protein SAMN02746009_00322 [Hymenobacter psychrotolerans DSM 18569]
MTGCDSATPNPDKVLVQDSFEPGNSAIADPQYFSTEQAYSWKHSIKLGQGLEFGTFYNGTWGSLGQHRLLRLRLWGWLKNPQQRLAYLTVVAQRPSDTPGGPAVVKIRHQFNIYEVIRRYQQWVPASFTVELPADLQPTDEVAVYMWVPAGQPDAVYIDDFSLEYLD